MKKAVTLALWILGFLFGIFLFALFVMTPPDGVPPRMIYGGRR